VLFIAGSYCIISKILSSAPVADTIAPSPYEIADEFVAREVEYRINDAKSPDDKPSSDAVVTRYPPYQRTMRIPRFASKILLIVKNAALR